MNLWKNTVLTKKGMKLQTKLMKGSTLKITKIKTGTGRAEIVDLREQTEVLGAKQQLLVQEMKQGEEEVVIPVLLNNTDVAEPYTLWQVGFYAEDPEEGEILYCLAQAEEGRMIPSNSESPGFSVTWNFHFKVSNDISMEVNLDPAGLVSVEIFEDWVEQSKQSMADVREKLAQLNSDLLEKVYPVGSIYVSVNNTNPGNIFGGTWERFAEGQTIFGFKESDIDFSRGKSGGEKEHILTVSEMPYHAHKVNSHTHAVPNHTHKIASSGAHRHGVYIKQNASGTSGGRNVVWPEDGHNDIWESATPSAGGHTHTVNSSGGCSTSDSAPNTDAIGNGKSHNNMPPYITAFIWKRVA